jgi:glutathione S-transferase
LHIDHDMSSPAPFTLYSNEYSYRSMMVQLLYEIRGKPRPGKPDIKLDRKYINLSAPAFEQLSEDFLVRLNAAGMVPVLVDNQDKYLDEPMAEVINITQFFSDWFPSLIPAEHKQAIMEMMHEVLNINCPVLTFGVPIPTIPLKTQFIKDKLNDPSTSNAYKSALEYRLDRYV